MLGQKARLSGDAEKRLREYSVLIEKVITQEGNGLSPFLSRLFVYTIKFAILYHLSGDRRDEITLDLPEIERSIKLAEVIRNSTEKIMSNIAFNEFQLNRQKVIEILENKEGNKIAYSDLLRKMRVPTRVLQIVLNTLKLEETIDFGKTTPISSTKPVLTISLLERKKNE